MSNTVIVRVRNDGTKDYFQAPGAPFGPIETAARFPEASGAEYEKALAEVIARVTPANPLAQNRQPPEDDWDLELVDTEDDGTSAEE